MARRNSLAWWLTPHNEQQYDIGEDDHDDYNGDGNKNKPEDDSAAAIADCDENDVDEAGFDCFGIAANEIDVDLGNDLVGLTGLGGSEQAAAQFAGEQWNRDTCYLEEV